MPTPETYSLKETGRILGVSTATIHRKVVSGDIPAIRLGERILIPRAYVDGLFAAAGYPRDAAEPAQGDLT
jgi:excisionase family DNA binding protein